MKNGMDTVIDSPLKRPVTGEPTLSPNAGIGPPGGGLGVASWKKQMAFMLMFKSIVHLVLKLNIWR